MNELSLLQLVLVGLGLSLDTLAISAAIGLGYRPITARTTFRISFHFSLFQVGLLLLGWWAGSFLNRYFGTYDDWVAAILLWGIGLHMCAEWWRNRPMPFRADPSRGLRLVLLSLANSIDALAVGASLGLLSAPILRVAAVLAVLTAALAILGLEVGRNVGKALGRWAFLTGGLALVALGTRIVWGHLAG